MRMPKTAPRHAEHRVVTEASQGVGGSKDTGEVRGNEGEVARGLGGEKPGHCGCGDNWRQGRQRQPELVVVLDGDNNGGGSSGWKKETSLEHTGDRARRRAASRHAGGKLR